jgi:hypothetical protein
VTDTAKTQRPDQGEDQDLIDAMDDALVDAGFLVHRDQQNKRYALAVIRHLNRAGFKLEGGYAVEPPPAWYVKKEKL